MYRKIPYFSKNKRFPSLPIFAKNVITPMKLQKLLDRLMHHEE